jgi:hypothetical protein
MTCYDAFKDRMQSDHTPKQRRPEEGPQCVFPTARAPLFGDQPPPPDFLFIEAVDEAAAKAHFQALLDGTATTSVRQAVPGVFLATAQESGRWWRFRAYITVA